LWRLLAAQRPAVSLPECHAGSQSDETGLLNVVVPPSVYQRDRAVAQDEALLWVTGVLERRGGGPTVRATQLHPLAAILLMPRG
jgi:error-prone DNA polymerase